MDKNQCHEIFFDGADIKGIELAVRTTLGFYKVAITGEGSYEDLLLPQLGNNPATMNVLKVLMTVLDKVETVQDEPPEMPTYPTPTTLQ